MGKIGKQEEEQDQEAGVPCLEQRLSWSASEGLLRLERTSFTRTPGASSEPRLEAPAQ